MYFSTRTKLYVGSKSTYGNIQENNTISHMISRIRKITIIKIFQLNNCNYCCKMVLNVCLGILRTIQDYSNHSPCISLIYMSWWITEWKEHCVADSADKSSPTRTLRQPNRFRYSFRWFVRGRLWSLLGFKKSFFNEKEEKFIE